MHKHIFHNTKTLKEVRKKLRTEQTPQERMVWAKIRNETLGVRFRRQYSVGKYVLDFYCPTQKLVVEIGGAQHGEDDALVYDKERTQFLEVQGITVLRFTNAEVNTTLEQVVFVIMQTIENNTTPPPNLPL